MKDPVPNDDTVVVEFDKLNGASKKDKTPGDDAAPASYETAIVACGFGKFHYIMLVMTFPMCAAQLFSSGSMGFALPTVECDLDLDEFQMGTLNGATYLGNLMSGLLWGGAADVFGRRKIISLCFFLDFFVSLASGFAPNYVSMLVLKVLAGVIIAGPNAVLYAYMAEVYDDKHRRMAILTNGMAFTFAQIVLPVVAYFLLPLPFRVTLVPGLLDLTSWRVFFLVCALPSLWSAIWFTGLPESPKFLMSKGRQEEALRVFQRVYAINTGKDPETYPIKVLDVPDVAKAAESSGGTLAAMKRGLGQFAPLFRTPLLSRMIIVSAVQFNVMICINSLRLWTPQLFALLEQYERDDRPSRPDASTTCEMISAALARPYDAVLNTTTSALGDVASRVCEASVSGDVYLRTLVVGAVGTSSYIVTGFLSKKFGNRPLLLLSFPLAMVTSLGMVWSTTSDIFMGLVALFSPLAAIGLTALSTILVDLFPTPLRGVSVSVVIMSGRLASLSGNLVLPVILNISCEALFFFVSLCLAFNAVVVWFIPKKANKDEDV